MIQFARGINDSHDYAIKFFLDPHAFIVEAALYAACFAAVRCRLSPEVAKYADDIAANAVAADPEAATSAPAGQMSAAAVRFLPQVEAVCDGAAGGLADPTGKPLPPCIVMEKGESLHDWSDRAEPDFFTSLAVRSSGTSTTPLSHASVACDKPEPGSHQALCTSPVIRYVAWWRACPPLHVCPHAGASSHMWAAGSMLSQLVSGSPLALSASAAVPACTCKPRSGRPLFVCACMKEGRAPRRPSAGASVVIGPIPPRPPPTPPGAPGHRSPCIMDTACGHLLSSILWSPGSPSPRCTRNCHVWDIHCCTQLIQAARVSMSSEPTPNHTTVGLASEGLRCATIGESSDVRAFGRSGFGARECVHSTVQAFGQVTVYHMRMIPVRRGAGHDTHSPHTCAPQSPPCSHCFPAAVGLCVPSVVGPLQALASLQASICVCPGMALPPDSLPRVHREGTAASECMSYWIDEYFQNREWSWSHCELSARPISNFTAVVKRFIHDMGYSWPPHAEI